MSIVKSFKFRIRTLTFPPCLGHKSDLKNVFMIISIDMKSLNIDLHFPSRELD